MGIGSKYGVTEKVHGGTQGDAKDAEKLAVTKAEYRQACLAFSSK